MTFFGPISLHGGHSGEFCCHAEDRLADIREDDVKLLQFGFEWLKATLFYADQEKFPAKKS